MAIAGITPKSCSGGAAVAIAAVVAALFLYPRGANALDEDLKGLQNVRVVVDELPPETLACGYTRSALETSLLFVLGQSKITISAIGTPLPSGPGPISYLHLRLLTTGSRPLCATRFDLSLTTGVTVGATKDYTFAEVWSWGGLQTGQDTPALLANVELGAKTFVNAWNSANK